MHRTHYLVWRRGFAPILFILAVALIVVSVGSGIYFMTKKSAPPVVAVEMAPFQKTEVTTTTPETAVSAAETKPAAPRATAYVDCGSVTRPGKCLDENVQICAPAKGTEFDPATGMTVERVVDGYKGDTCSYRTTILSAPSTMAVLAGMNIDCMIPRANLVDAVRGGAMNEKDMLAFCSGAFIDFMNARRVSAQ